MSSRLALYTARVEEMKQWMNDRDLGSCVELLVSEGYDDLEAISRCNDAELEESVDCLVKDDEAARSTLR